MIAFTFRGETVQIVEVQCLEAVAARHYNASSNSATDIFACITTTLTCPAFPSMKLSNATMHVIAVGETIRGEMTRELFGKTVNVNCGETIIAVGSSEYNDRSGKVKVYQWVETGSNDSDATTATPKERSKTAGWVQLGQTLGPQSDNCPDRFGYSVSLSKDGKRLAIGGRVTDSILANGTTVENVGGAFVYEIRSDVWEPVGEAILG